jgi:nucleoside-diphosphate-sugar epimerase
MKGKKILLIGALGFIGSNIARRLISEGYNVDCFDDLSFGSKKNLSPEMKISYLSFQGITSQQYLDMFDTCVFVACANIIYAIDEPIKTFVTNGMDSIEFFDKFKGKIVFTCTTSVYGQLDTVPTPETATIKTNNAYDTSKRIAELALLQRKNVTILRLSNCYGEWQRPENPYCGVVGKLVSQALKKEPLTIVGDGLQTRDYTYVGDVCDAIVLSVEQEAKNECINIASGKETDILTLASEIDLLVVGSERDSDVVKLSPRAIDKISRRCLLIEKANYLLGWQPKTSLADGLKATIQWQIQEYHKEPDSHNQSASQPVKQS